MITDMAGYLKYFDGVRRRTERDVAALPAGASAWTPPAREGEAGWGIGQIVSHIGATRLYFASAYRGEVEPGRADVRDDLADAPARLALARGRRPRQIGRAHV